jgi:hypothetical protein
VHLLLPTVVHVRADVQPGTPVHVGHEWGRESDFK